jgi:dethiobiotin synthetase
MKNVFFVGTDTSVGKTLVVASIAYSLNKSGGKVGVFKPFQSGGIRNKDGFVALTDADILLHGVTNENMIPSARASLIQQIAPWSFEPDLAPFVLLDQKGIEVTLEEIINAYQEVAKKSALTFVEGAGGVAAPLCGHIFSHHLALALDSKVVVVARLGLGTINHSLLTIDYLRHNGVEPQGIIFVDTDGIQDKSKESNPSWVADLGNINVIGTVPYLGSLGLEAPSSNHFKIVSEALDFKPLFVF